MYQALRAPFSCLIILAFIAYFYKKEIRLKTEASRLFKNLLSISIANTLLQLITEFTVNNRNIIPELVNLMFHNMFLISILLVCFYVYKYLLTMIEMTAKTNLQIERIISHLLLLVCIIFIFITPLSYIDTPYGSYSLGGKATSLYVGIIYLFSLIIFHLIKDKKNIIPIQRKIIWMFIFVYALFGSVQILFPFVLLTGLGITLEVLGIYLSFENPEKYVDENSTCFNELGFKKILSEKIFLTSDDSLIVYSIKGANLDNISLSNILKNINKTLHDYKISCYRLSDNVFATFTKNKYIEIAEEYIFNKTFIELDSYENVLDKIENFKLQNLDTELFIDQMTEVYNRNKYEYDIKNLLNDKQNMWYVLVDINNLKETNDTLGHEYGDKLIKTVATLLKDTFNSNSFVYRFGGDEFVIISRNKIIDKEIEKLKELNGENSAVRFAYGYAHYIVGKSDWNYIMKTADKNMYENKIKSKKNK